MAGFVLLRYRRLSDNYLIQQAREAIVSNLWLFDAIAPRKLH